MTDNANIKLDGNKLKDFNKTWDGLPMHRFRKNFYIPFLFALGSIIMDGVALRDTINGVDHGGHANGAPNANAAQQAQRQSRIRRIFSVLMAHIDPTSAIYSELEADYDNEGLIALDYIQEDGVGNKPIPTTEISKIILPSV